MYELSIELSNYIDDSICEIQIPQIKDAFRVMGLFDVPFLEDKYINLILNSEIDPMLRESNFRNLLLEDLVSILTVHKITLLEESEYNIPTITSIVEAIYKVQHLESYDFILAQLSDFEQVRSSFINIIMNYSDVSFIVLHSIIDTVDKTFMESLTELATTRQALEELAPIVKERTLYFFRYIGDQECLGKELYESGYDSLMTYEETCNALSFEVEDRIKKRMETSMSKSALDILSLFMICSDASQTPLQFFNEHSESLIHNSDFIPIIFNIFKAMYSDFETSLKQAVNIVESEQKK